MKIRIVACVLMSLLLANTSYSQDTLALEPASQVYGSGIAPVEDNLLVVYEGQRQENCSYIEIANISNPYEPVRLDFFSGFSLPSSNERVSYHGQITGAILYDDAIFWCTMEDFGGWQRPSTYGPINLKGHLFDSEGEGWRLTRELYERGQSPIDYPGNLARYEEFLIVAGGEAGIMIFDMSDPENPEHVSRLDYSNNRVITVQEKLCIYQTPDRGRLTIYDISNPEQPENTGGYQIDYEGCPYQMQTDPVIYNDCLVLRNNSELEPHSSLLLMDVSSENPLNGEMIVLDREYGRYRFYISNDRLYVHPSGENYVDIFDINENLEVAHAATLSLSQTVNGHFIVHDNKLLFTSGGTYIYDISPVSVSSPQTNQPSGFSLSAYPNPFNSTTSINFELSQADYVTLGLYNMAGQQINGMFEGYRQAGTYSISLSAENLASGVYFVGLKGSRKVLTRKILLIR